jgi:hypothetical protein
MTGHCMDEVYIFLVAVDSFFISSNTPAVSPPLVNMNSVVEQLSTSQAGFYNRVN